MASVPTNEKLYHMVVFQAKLKYHPYPSPGASAWVHKRYEELGGKFEDTSEKTKKEKLAKRMLEHKRRNKLAHGDHDARDSKQTKGE